MVADIRPLKREDLSWKAKGILMYLLTLPDNWDIYIKELVSHATDGKDSTKTGVDELMKQGYIWRKQKQSENGQFSGYEYWVSDEPVAENPLTVNPLTENPQLLNIKGTKELKNPPLEKNWNFSFDTNDDRLKRPSGLDYVKDGSGIPYQRIDALNVLTLYYSWEGKTELVKEITGFTVPLELIKKSITSFVQKLEVYNSSHRSFKTLHTAFLRWVVRDYKDYKQKGDKILVVNTDNYQIDEAIKKYTATIASQKRHNKRLLTRLKSKTPADLLREMDPIIKYLKLNSAAFSSYSPLTADQLVYLNHRYFDNKGIALLLEKVKKIALYRTKHETLYGAIKIQLQA